MLEKCKTTNEVIESIKTLPIASKQTLTIVDHTGNIVVIECNAENIEVIKPNIDGDFVVATDEFNSENMKKYNNYNIDDWKAQERYEVAYNTLKIIKINFHLNYQKIFCQAYANTI